MTDLEKELYKCLHEFNETIEYNKLMANFSELTGLNKEKIHKFSFTIFKLIIIFMIKNMAYKDSYKKHGVLGIIIRCSDKIDRLYNLELADMKGQFIHENDESKSDNLNDIAVYGILGCMEIEERNK